MMEAVVTVMEWMVETGIPAVVGAVVALAGRFLFHREEKESKMLDNEIKRAELEQKSAERERERADEWRRLYIESKEDSDRKEDIIREYQEKEHSHMVENARLEARCAALECQRCEVYGCTKRRPPLSEQYVESDRKYNADADINQDDPDKGT